MAQRLTWIVWGSLMNRGAGRLSARLASSREMPWPNEQRPDKGPKNVRLVGSSSGAREISEATRQRQDLKSKDSGLARSGRRAGIIKHGKDEKSRVPVTEGEGVAGKDRLRSQCLTSPASWNTMCKTSTRVSNLCK